VIWNEELALPQAWIFDAHLLDQGWNEPRCAQACPTGAMAALRLDDEEWRARAAADGLSSIRPELETRPSVLYRHLSRATHSFIAGSVFAVRDGVKDCVEGAVVSLRASGKEIAFAATDAFGDFRFDGLEPMSGPYEVAVRHDRGRATVAVPQSRESVALADIELTPPG
jgi:hypothetical protein